MTKHINVSVCTFTLGPKIRHMFRSKWAILTWDTRFKHGQCHSWTLFFSFYQLEKTQNAYSPRNLLWPLHLKKRHSSKLSPIFFFSFQTFSSHSHFAVNPVSVKLMEWLEEEVIWNLTVSHHDKKKPVAAQKAVCWTKCHRANSFRALLSLSVCRVSWF